MEELKRCPFCKRKVDIKTAGGKFYIGCFDKDCMVNPTTELFQNEEDAVKTWNQSEPIVIQNSVLQEIYTAVEQCEERRNKLSSDIARIKAENETYHFIMDVLGIKRK